MSTTQSNKAADSKGGSFSKVAATEGLETSMSGESITTLKDIENGSNSTIDNLSSSLFTQKWIVIVIVACLVTILLLLLSGNNHSGPATGQPTQVNPIQVPWVQDHIPDFKHKHSGLTFDYPTIGIPVPGQTYNDTLVQPKDLAAFDQQVIDILKPYNDTDCELTHYGNDDDGGYTMCENFINKAEGLINIGIRNTDNFGCELTSKHPMPNYQYDCTTSERPSCWSNKVNNQYFDICVGAKTQQTERYMFYTLQDMLKSHNLTQKHIILKIDCEGGQYAGFKYFPTKYLDQIDQIIMQLHFDHLYYEQWGQLDILRTLNKHFVSVNMHFNNWACFQGDKKQLRKLKSVAVEVVLVNRKLIKLKSQSRSFAMLPWNTRALTDRPDCQLHD